MKTLTAETRKRTSGLSWRTESENHAEGAQLNDAINKYDAMLIKF